MNLIIDNIWGIHCFIQSLEAGMNQSSYFLKRDFGNYLILPLTKESSEQNELITAKGGISHQLVSKPAAATDAQVKAFEKFGAPLVDLSFKEGLFDPRIRLINSQDEFYDPDVTNLSLDLGKAVLIRAKKVSYLFFDDSFVLDRGVIRKRETFEEVERPFLKSAHIPWNYPQIIGFFHFHRGDNWLDLTSMVN